MIRRHPHVFGDASRDKTADEQTARLGARSRPPSARRGRQRLAGIAAGLPALTRAVKLQNRAARVGFDWPDAGAVLDKIAEETAELVEARDAGDAARVAEEYGDLMFVMANLARHLKVDPEAALRAANAKFTRRFEAIEAALAARGPHAGRLRPRRDGRALGRRQARGARPSGRMTGATPGEEFPEPPRLRRLRRLVTLLTATLIVGVITIVGLLVIRLTARRAGPGPAAEIRLPAGERARAVTFGSDWLAVVTVDGEGRERIRVLDRATGAERGNERDRSARPEPRRRARR